MQGAIQVLSFTFTFFDSRGNTRVDNRQLTSFNICSGHKVPSEVQLGKAVQAECLTSS